MYDNLSSAWQGANETLRRIICQIRPASNRTSPDAAFDASRFSLSSAENGVIKLTRTEIHCGDESFSAIEGGPPNAIDSTPIVFWSHATGFHAAAYRPLLERLAERVRIQARDARGHGHSLAKASIPLLKTWRPFYNDLIASLDALPNGVRVVLAGHSFGATASVFAAAARLSRVSSLVLVEPVFYLPGTGTKPRKSLVKATSRRRGSFASLEEACTSYRTRKAFLGLSDEWLKAYVDDAFVQSEGSGYRLRCSPKWESACFEANERWPWWAIARANVPAHILVAEQGSSCPKSARRILRLLQPAWQLSEVAGTTHLLAMETPDTVFDAIIQAAFPQSAD